MHGGGQPVTSAQPSTKTGNTQVSRRQRQLSNYRFHVRTNKIAAHCRTVFLLQSQSTLVVAVVNDEVQYRHTARTLASVRNELTWVRNALPAAAVRVASFTLALTRSSCAAVFTAAPSDAAIRLIPQAMPSRTSRPLAMTAPAHCQIFPA